MKTHKIVHVEGEIAPLTRTEENMLKGGFGNVATTLSATTRKRKNKNESVFL
jgi:hypothetical protein